MELILGFTTALLLSVVLTPFFMRYAAQLQLVDIPKSERHVHEAAIPRVGGLSIVIAAFVSAGYWDGESTELLTLYAGGSVIALFGLLDDYAGLHYLWKFFGQILAVVLTMAGGVIIAVVPGLGMEPAPLWVSYPLTFLFLLGVINAVNLADGLDGLAGGTILLSLGLILVFFLQLGLFPYALFTLAVMGAVLGFLRYNTHPAQVFMGDTGSQFLGFITASLAVIVTQDVHTPLNPVIPLFIVGLPILDTLLVMSIRKAKGQSFFVADNSHIHHQLLAIGFRHYEVVALLYLIQALFILLAWRYRYAADTTILAVYMLFCGVIVGSIGVMRTQNIRIRRRSDVAVGKNRRNHFLRRFTWLHLNGARLIEALLSALLVFTALLCSEESLGQPLLIAGLTALLLWPLLSKVRFMWVTRLLAYTAAIMVASVPLWGPGLEPSGFDTLLDGYLLVVVVTLVLAIRVTRRDRFRLDTQDLLVLFLVLALPLLPFDDIDRYQLGHVAIRLAVLFYACEYVVNAGHGCNVLLRMASVVSLVLVGFTVV